MNELASGTTDTQAADTSLADHEAQFSRPSALAPVVDEPIEDDEPRARRHSSGSVARASDVEQIAELTKRLRTAETDLGFTVERKDGESQRVYELRRKAEIAEAIRDARKVTPTEPKPAPVVTDAPTFEEKEPSYDDEDIQNAADPVVALNRKLAAYDRRKERFEQQQNDHKTQSDAARKAASDHDQQTVQSHKARETAFKAAHPDAEAVWAKADGVGQIPPLLTWAIISDDKGPDLMYYFANHLDQLEEMMLLAGSNPATDSSVALMRRRLHARAQADSTGAAASVQLPRVVPRPPTPVRTAPMKTERPDPSDDSPLSEHEKRYGQHAGRGRR